MPTASSAELGFPQPQRILLHGNAAFAEMPQKLCKFPYPDHTSCPPISFCGQFPVETHFERLRWICMLPLSAVLLGG